RVLAQMEGVPRLVARLQYGTGMRLGECLSLRVQDLDFERAEVLVRHGKGGDDRRTVLPRAIQPELQAHLARRKKRHAGDVGLGGGEVLLPDAMDRKVPGRARNGAGSGSSPRRGGRGTRARGGTAGTTRTGGRSSGRSRRRAGRWG